jgi:oxygen-independent coproporphyrinogen-3 oxidase
MTEPNSKTSLDDIYLYINIPFCLKRCRYCYCTLMFPETDLLSWKKNLGSYVDALVKEINSYNGSEKRILGISFGGGTPSLLSVSQFEQILDALRNSCPVLDSKAQVSIEVFPGTKTRRTWKQSAASELTVPA